MLFLAVLRLVTLWAEVDTGRGPNLLTGQFPSAQSAGQFPSSRELQTEHQIPHGWQAGSCWLACVWPNAPTISLIFSVLRTAASVNQWDLSVISIYEGTTQMPCCHAFPSLLMAWKETKNQTLFSGPLSATRRLEASLNRMEMTSWILILYLCTF